MNMYSEPLGLIDLFDNPVLTWGLVACGIAQTMKLFFELIINQRWRPEIIFETGGMPSSHSALVTGISAGIGLEQGFNSSIFAFTLNDKEHNKNKEIRLFIAYL